MSRTARPMLLGVGGAHVDRRGRFLVEFVPGASNPGTMAQDVGGGTFNALRLAVQRGVDATLASVRGGDDAGALVARTAIEAGIADISATFLDRATPSYTAMLARDGDVVAALADMQLYEIAFPRQVRRSGWRDAVAGAQGVLTDANLPAAALERLAQMRQGKPLFAIAISPAKAPRLAAILPRLDCLFMNMREAAALAGTGAEGGPSALVAALRGRGLARGVITGGGAPVTLFEADGIRSVDPPRPETVADVTGAGDALAGGTIAALLRGLAFAAAVREGMAAALLALESPRSVPQATAQEFAAALERVPQPRIAGDVHAR